MCVGESETGPARFRVSLETLPVSGAKPAFQQMDNPKPPLGLLLCASKNVENAHRRFRFGSNRI